VVAWTVKIFFAKSEDSRSDVFTKNTSQSICEEHAKEHLKSNDSGKTKNWCWSKLEERFVTFFCEVFAALVRVCERNSKPHLGRVLKIAGYEHGKCDVEWEP
jgi:hypothetical protein